MKDQEIIIFKENKFYFQLVYKRYAASKEGEIFLVKRTEKYIIKGSDEYYQVNVYN